jgi:hypothetical protein
LQKQETFVKPLIVVRKMEKVPVMFPTIPQNSGLLKHLEELLEVHRPIFKQARIFERIKALVFGEIMRQGHNCSTSKEPPGCLSEARIGCIEPKPCYILAQV